MSASGGRYSFGTYSTFLTMAEMADLRSVTPENSTEVVHHPPGANASNLTGYSYMDDFMNFDFAFDVDDLALSSSFQVTLITVYTLTILFSVTGNLLVILVLLSAKRTRTEINVFLINLAIADLCMACFCMPFTFTQTMLGRWVFGRFMCPLVLFMQVTSVTVSIYTNMAIGIDRFWGIVFPMRPRITKTMARVVTAGIWLFSTAVGSAQFYVSRSNQQEYRGVEYWSCNERWPTERGHSVYTVVIACLTYFLPLSILAAVYSIIGSILWTRKAPGNADGVRDKIILRSKQKVVKMVFTLVVVFAICWFPLHTFNLVLDFAPHVLDYIRTTREQLIFVAVYYTCHWMAMANSSTNPIIFCFLNDNFRADLRSMLLCRITLGRQHPSVRASGRSTRTLALRLSHRFSKGHSPRSSVSARNRSDTKQAESEVDDMTPLGDDHQNQAVDDLLSTARDCTWQDKQFSTLDPLSLADGQPNGLSTSINR